jgi:hypothetical protein
MTTTTKRNHGTTIGSFTAAPSPNCRAREEA